MRLLTELAQRERAGKGIYISTHRQRRLPKTMETTNTESLKDQLLVIDPEFRELARTHTRYEARLSELMDLAHPSNEEQLEEVTLKKKKLAVKDQMQEIMTRHQVSTLATH